MKSDGTFSSVLILKYYFAVKWKIANEIIIFGNTVLLHCKLNVGSFCNGTSTRRWTKGKRQTNLVLNGTSSDSKKYKETVDKDCNGATLYIYSFNEKDIDAYTCAHDFDEYTDTIKLHEIKYRSKSLCIYTVTTRAIERKNPNRKKHNVIFFSIYSKPLLC